MSIPVVNEVAMATQTLTQENYLPKPSEINRFDKLLLAPLPEHVLIEQLVNKGVKVESGLAINATNMASVPSPEVLLSGQALMAHAIVQVDLAAKTAGVLSQSINKLVNMQ